MKIRSLQTLSDQDKRKIYDKHGEEGLKRQGGEDSFHDPFSRLKKKPQKFDSRQ